MKLVVRGVSKTFGSNGGCVRALEGVDLEVRDGEFVALLGPSGCGKTTLLRLVAGLDVPTEGEIVLDGKPVAGPGVDRGLVSQEYGLFPWLSVWGNIDFGLRLNDVPEEWRFKVVGDFVRLTGLSGFEDAYPSELSGGMKQRVALARTMVNDPEILLLDEPFGALDTQTRSLMQELLLDVWENKKKTVLLVTHDIEEAIFLADTVYVATSKPCSIKAKIKVNLPRPRTFSMKSSKKFIELRKSLHELIREESLKAMQPITNKAKKPLRSPTKRMTFSGFIKTTIYDIVIPR
ncbi:MAG: ABC transporter ATP-binding protein [Candidatus Altiarchaeota archaeon]|nr:ABC transporter ATP-binding protein [Candidatus Altiarchaeota archaeon]